MTHEVELSYLNDAEICKLVICILVKRLGGNVVIAQADIDDVAYNRLHEDHMSDGTLRLRFEEKRANG